MPDRSSHRAPKTAAELIEALRNDANYHARIASKQRVRMEAAANLRSSSAPILDDLRKIGINVASLDELRIEGRKYAAAIPLLVSWLSKIDDDRASEALVRALSYPWAANEAEGPLIDLYLSLETAKHQALKWAIGNALSVMSGEKHLDRLLEILQDKKHGTTRQMIVLSVANVPAGRSEAILTHLLTDPQVVGHAIMALGKVGTEKAAASLKPFLKHKSAWLRAEAKRPVL